MINKTSNIPKNAEIIQVKFHQGVQIKGETLSSCGPTSTAFGVTVSLELHDNGIIIHSDDQFTFVNYTNICYIRFQKIEKEPAKVSKNNE